MSVSIYTRAQAAILVAVCNLQQSASQATNLFHEERFTRAADNLLRSYDSLPQQKARFSDGDVALAVEPPIVGEPRAITDLRDRGHAKAKKAATNVKRTVRRRFALQSPCPPERECNTAPDVENRLECQDLLAQATPNQRRVLALRLTGVSDEMIGNELGITAGNVAVLAHRGINRIRERAAAWDAIETLTA